MLVLPAAPWISVFRLFTGAREAITHGTLRRSERSSRTQVMGTADGLHGARRHRPEAEIDASRQGKDKLLLVQEMGLSSTTSMVGRVFRCLQNQEIPVARY
jgi:hypothetical protein